MNNLLLCFVLLENFGSSFICSCAPAVPCAASPSPPCPPPAAAAAAAAAKPAEDDPFPQAGGGAFAVDHSAAVVDPARFDASLWPLRAQLAAAYRALHTLGLNRMTYNHCTADAGRGRFLVNRYGLSWREVTAENLLLVDLAGRLLEGEGPLMTAAFVIHSEIHAALGMPRAAVVMHTHQPAATALACTEGGVVGLSGGGGGGGGRDGVGSIVVGGQLCAYDPLYGGIVNDADEGARIARALGTAGDGGSGGTGAATEAAHVLLMASHGVTVVAPSVAEGVSRLHRLELGAIAAIARLREAAQSSEEGGGVVAGRATVAAVVPEAVLRGAEAYARAFGGPPLVEDDDAEAYFAAECAKPENGCAAERGGWDGRGEFPAAAVAAAAAAAAEEEEGEEGDGSAGAATAAAAAVAAAVDLAAAARLLAPLLGSGSCSGCEVAVLSVAPGDNGCGTVLVAPPPTHWPATTADAIIAEGAPLGQAAAGSAVEAALGELAARLRARHGGLGRAVLIAAAAPQYAAALAAAGHPLLPVVQDAMLFDGHVALLSPGLGARLRAGGAAGAAAVAQLDAELEVAAAAHCAEEGGGGGGGGGGRALRLAVGEDVVVALGNSAAHVHSLVDRYDKAACVQLLATATGRPLRRIDEAVVRQEQNAFLCGTREPLPKSAQMHLDSLKRLMQLRS